MTRWDYDSSAGLNRGVRPGGPAETRAVPDASQPYERFDSSLICLSTMAMTNNSGGTVQLSSC